MEGRAEARRQWVIVLEPLAAGKTVNQLVTVVPHGVHRKRSAFQDIEMDDLPLDALGQDLARVFVLDVFQQILDPVDLYLDFRFWIFDFGLSRGSPNWLTLELLNS